nr:MAG TPA: hypothetical protein [Caudoviricetes sp.]
MHLISSDHSFFTSLSTVGYTSVTVKNSIKSASNPYKSRKLRFLRLRLKLYSLYILIFTKFYTIIKY